MSEEARLALGRRIRDAREARGLDQYGLAALVKKNQGYISRIERGQFNLRIDTIASLAVALGMDIDHHPDRPTEACSPIPSDPTLLTWLRPLDRLE